MEIIGIDKEKVEKISSLKNEEDWIRDFRLESFNNFLNTDMPKFGPKIELDFNKIIYYKRDEKDLKIESDWNNVLKPVVDELDELDELTVYKRARTRQDAFQI